MEYTGNFSKINHPGVEVRVKKFRPEVSAKVSPVG